MQNKYLFFSGVGLVLLSVIFSVFYSNEASLSPSNSILEECKSLVYNGEGKVNLLFFANEKITQEYADYLLSYSPFKENKENFNVYFIDNYVPNCELYQGQAVFCYSKELIRKSASCPNIDLIYAFSDEANKIRSSAYMNVVSLNVNHAKPVILHETGHALANLAEEYVPASLPKNAKNCAATCTFDECFAGCSKSEYYRSIENGVMRTLKSTNFGSNNERLILDKISTKINSKITGFATESISECSVEEYLLIEGIASDNGLEITSQSIESGCYNLNGEGDYSYSIKEDQFSYSGNFNPSLIFTDAEGDNQIDGETFTNIEELFVLTFPIDENYNSLEIFDENSNSLIELNLQHLGAQPCKV